jgi:DNA-directed RNA polymerase specialized sigma24 family protein
MIRPAGLNHDDRLLPETQPVEKSWLFTIALNTVRDHYRARARHA